MNAAKVHAEGAELIINHSLFSHLEEAVARAIGVSAVLSGAIVRDQDHYNRANGGAVANGMVLVSHKIEAGLEAAYDAAHNEWAACRETFPEGFPFSSAPKALRAHLGVLVWRLRAAAAWAHAMGSALAGFFAGEDMEECYSELADLYPSLILRGLPVLPEEHPGHRDAVGPW